MVIKGLTDEDFVNYKLPSMFITTSYCTFKCDLENGTRCCQNSGLANARIIDIDTNKIIERYLGNKITKAIVFGGLEPLEQFDEVYEFISSLRNNYHCSDTVVIYTGFEKKEILTYVEKLKEFANIVIKYGRYIPNQQKAFDNTLGVWLASPNQYAETIS